MHTICIRLNIAVVSLNIVLTTTILIELAHPVFLFFVAACGVASVIEMGLSLLFFTSRVICRPIQACRGETPELKEDANSLSTPLMHFLN